MAPSSKPRVGILDHTGNELGGAQLVAASMAAVLREFDVEILHSGSSPLIPLLCRYFDIQLDGATERRVGLISSFNIPGPAHFREQLRANAAELTAPYDIFIYSGHGAPPFCHARYGLVYCHFPFEAHPREGAETTARWGTRSPLDRGLRGLVYRWAWRKRMRGYAKVLTNSQYTANWIRRLWRREAEVLYPPVELEVPVREKCNTIISVGRFTGGPRSKGQLEQVHAFRSFITRSAEPWTLIVAGSCGEDGMGKTYLQSVKAAAEGLPVRFMVGVDRAAVVEALARAKIFWHTVGLGIDEEKEPALAEHFGIATVEAMRAGCVPIVVPSGGQREVVEPGSSGYHARSVDQLVEHTLELAGDPDLLEAMKLQAAAASARFSKIAFDRHFQRIVDECLSDAPILWEVR